jgi:SPP1 family predicted phage head-tail adaptor
MLTARKYNKPITLVLYSSATDDFGKGEIKTSEDVLSTFADVNQSNSSRVRIENCSAVQTAMRFAIRYTDKAFNAVRYKGVEYITNSVENVNEENRELVIYAQRAE